MSKGESLDHLLLHCDVAHALWGVAFQIFGIHWVMPGSVASLLFCWRNWFRKHGSIIWKLEYGTKLFNVNVWKEWNHCLFEETKNSLDQLKSMFRCTLLNGQCGGAFLIVHPSLSS